MSIIKFSTAFLLLTLVSATSCSKKDKDADDDDFEDPQTPYEVLSNGYWSIDSSFNVSVDQTVVTNAELHPCRLDDKYDFDIEGVYSWDPGNDKCPGQEDGELKGAGEWQLLANATQLIVNGKFWEVLSFSDTAMVIQTFPDGRDHLVRDYYTHHR